MSDIGFNRFSVPIVTGTPQTGKPAQPQQNIQPEKPFAAFLQEQMQQSTVEFSRHAATRVVQRNIPLSEASLQRLNDGVRLAKEKGLNDTLVLVDGTAFLVSAQNGKVITTVGMDELKGNVFTNIDGTVVM